MSEYWLSRAELLVGEENLQELAQVHVAVVGIGGIGGFAVECLARAGVGKLTLVDGDIIEESNRNRQLVALRSNDTKPKAQEMAERCKDISSTIEVEVVQKFLNPENLHELGLEGADYILDCIDTLTPKTLLIQYAKSKGIPIVSCLGAGGKFDPSQVRVTDISKTYNCTLARAVRKRLYKLGIRKGVEVVFSPEPVDKTRLLRTDGSNYKKSSLGTISYMPPLLGLHAASVVIRKIILQ